MKKLAVIVLVFVLTCRWVLALGGDYRVGVPLLVPTDYPTGLAGLRDHQCRVHGYFVNMEDLFFYSGDTVSFNRFLTNYATLQICSHTLTLHQGSGLAKSPWNHGQGVSCDWKMYIAPRWRKGQVEAKTATEAIEIIRNNPGYVINLELWLEGGVDFARVKVPAIVTIIPAGEATKIDASASAPRKRK